MAFFAVEDDEMIEAWDADPKGIYWCLECFAPVKVRRGKNRFPHFYHIASAPSCRLYSKSEDHLLIQLQLQKSLPQGESHMERPISEISRVSDLLWEKEKVAFEIQCSTIFEPEAASRMKEYRTAGFEVVWILDDRIFNKRQLRPAEEFLRCYPCYFATVSRTAPVIFYDQFEIFLEKKRIKKGKPQSLDFQKIRSILNPQWPKILPRQIEKRIPHCNRYFKGDLIDRSLLAHEYPMLARSLENWRALEIHLAKIYQKPGWMKRLYRTFLQVPYRAFLNALLKRTL